VTLLFKGTMTQTRRPDGARQDSLMYGVMERPNTKNYKA